MAKRRPVVTTSATVAVGDVLLETSPWQDSNVVCRVEYVDATTIETRRYDYGERRFWDSCARWTYTGFDQRQWERVPKSKVPKRMRK